MTEKMTVWQALCDSVHGKIERGKYFKLIVAFFDHRGGGPFECRMGGPPSSFFSGVGYVHWMSLRLFEKKT